MKINAALEKFYNTNQATTACKMVLQFYVKLYNSVPLAILI